MNERRRENWTQFSFDEFQFRKGTESNEGAKVSLPFSRSGMAHPLSSHLSLSLSLFVEGCFHYTKINSLSLSHLTPEKLLSFERREREREKSSNSPGFVFQVT